MITQVIDDYNLTGSFFCPKQKKVFSLEAVKQSFSWHTKGHHEDVDFYLVKIMSCSPVKYFVAPSRQDKWNTL